MAARKPTKRSTKQQSKQQKKQIHLSLPLVIILLLLAAGLAFSTYLELVDNGTVAAISDSVKTADESDEADTAKTAPELAVYYLDVGQGDSELIVANGEAMLIDAGEAESGDMIVSYIQNLGITKLKYIVATHPHADHIGGLPTVINAFDVEQIIVPVIPDEQIPTTRVYEDFLTAVEDNDLKLTAAKAGDSLKLGDAKITVLSPGADEQYSDLNDYSVVLRMVYGKSRWLFTGDAEKPAEEAILERAGASGESIVCDIIKVGHHGSENSSTAAFLAVIKPQAAVIEVGDGNSYNHPTGEALERLGEYTSKIYRTDLEGTIIFTSDGEKIAHVNN
jgi:beta-lactamase superfamily II metal-dependent hydrolase